MSNTRRCAQYAVVCVAVAAMLIVVCPGAWGQNAGLDVSQYAHTAWKVSDGFTQGPILSIAQTPDGYLWLSTEFGLYRFDGIRAVPWQPPAGQQLPSIHTRSLLVARDGTLWISTIKGLASWKDGKLTQYPELAGQAIARLVQDREGTIWMGAFNPGRLCAIRNGRAQCYGEGSFGVGVYNLYEDHEGNLWVMSATGLWRWNSSRPEHYQFPDGGIDGIIEGENGEYLLATSKGLKKLADGKIQDYALAGVAGFRPAGFFRSSDGSLWIGTMQGLLHVHEGRTDTFGIGDGLSGDAVFTTIEDREGDIWTITTNGLDRFREYAIPKISRSQGLSTANAWSVQATSNGTIWIGTADGLNQWRNGRVTVYGRQTTIGKTRTSTQRSDGGLASNAQSLGLDERGRVYTSTRDGIFYFEGDRFNRIPNSPGGNVWAISGDGHGKLWVNDGTAGLYYFAPGEAAQPIPWSRFGQKGFGAQAILPDHSLGGIWLAFWDGGVVHFKDGEVRASYGAADGLGTGRATDLRFGSRGTLWVGTEGGLSRIRDGHVRTLTSKNGLPCDTVLWTMEDDEHSVWIYMTCGLVRIARSELDAWVSDPGHKVQTRVFGASDGVSARGVLGGYGPHVTKARDGKIWFANVDGVSVIDPKHLPVNNLPPPVHIEQVKADHKPYDVAFSASNLRLPALTRDLEIDYTALSLVAPEKMQFRTKLEGWDDDWQDAGNLRQAFYTGLAPKHYRFRVRASNNSGVWSESDAVMDFQIAPAFYQALWFRTLCVLALGGMVWAFYRMQVRHVAALYKGRMEERLQERERIARDLHDTFLQSVQGLVLKFDAVSKQIPCEQPARKAMEKALDLADEVLMEGRSRVRNLRDSTESLNDLPAAFRRVAEEMPGNQQSEFKAVVEGCARELHPMVLEESYCIGREALMNALSHSGGLHIEAEITYDARQFRLRIRDDGRGIDPAILECGGRTGHWGLQGMRERAQRIGGQLEFWSRPGTGTEVELRVPGGTAYHASGTPSKRTWFAHAFNRNGRTS